MERSQVVENFIVSWNADFPNFALTVADLKNPHMLMGALFQVFERLEIDRDAVLAPPPEESRNESTTYYWDLLPVINMTRVMNHLISVMPQVGISFTVSHFLQPTAVTSHSILLLQINMMVFKDQRLMDIAPFEEELFEKTNQVKALEDKKHKLVELLNEQAEEKGKRAAKMEKLNLDIKQFEEELKTEKDMRKLEEQELEAIIKENAQAKTIVEQKKTHRDALKEEGARKRALRVYDADDIKAQAEQATQNVQEVDEKLNVLGAILKEKESSLKNLQSIKPCLDQAQNLNNEIMNLYESMKESESGDLDVDGEEGELDVLTTELAELRATLAELHAARADAEARRQDGLARRQQEKTALQIALQEAEEKDRKSQEICKVAAQRTEDIKQLTFKYQQEKMAAFEEVAQIKGDFSKQLETIEELLLREFDAAQKFIEDKLSNRKI